jgi:hypothetical protein
LRDQGAFGDGLAALGVDLDDAARDVGGKLRLALASQRPRETQGAQGFDRRDGGGRHRDRRLGLRLEGARVRALATGKRRGSDQNEGAERER